MERVMGFEPTTSTLARLHSTTELHPLSENDKLEIVSDWEPKSSPYFPACSIFVGS